VARVNPIRYNPPVQRRTGQPSTAPGRGRPRRNAPPVPLLLLGSVWAVPVPSAQAQSGGNDDDADIWREVDALEAEPDPEAEAEAGDPPNDDRPPPPPDESRPLSLERLLDAARASYPGLRADVHAVEAAEARLEEAKVSPFLQFRAEGFLTVAPEARGTPIMTPDSQLPLSNRWRPIVGASLEGIFPLYTFGKIQAGRRAAEAGVAAAEQRREVTLDRVAFDVRRAFFTLQLALDLQQMIDEGASRLQRAQRVLGERIEAGEPGVEPSDRYRLSTASAEVAARASSAQALEANARRALELLTGIDDVRISDCPIEPVVFEAEPLDDYVEAARTGRPDLARLSAGIDALEANTEVQRAGYFPDFGISLGAGASYGPGVTNQTNPFIQDRPNFTSLRFALVFRWNLDLLGNHYRVRQAEARLSETRQRAEEAALGAELEVTAAYTELEDAARRETAWRDARREGRAWLVSASQAYELGTADARDLIDAVRTYFTSRAAHLEAIHAYNLAVAELERTVGLDLVRSDRWEVDCSF